VEEPRSGRLATADADLLSLSHGHLVDADGRPAQRRWVLLEPKERAKGKEGQQFHAADRQVRAERRKDGEGASQRRRRESRARVLDAPIITAKQTIGMIVCATRTGRT